MTRLLVIVALFAIPIVAQESSEVYDKFGFPETIDRLVCKNASAAVLEKQETLYQDYLNCIKNTIDLKQMNMDMRFMMRTIMMSMKFAPTNTDLLTSSIRLYSKSYCPKLNTLMDCETTYSSIYKDCLPAAEVQAKKIKSETVHRMVNYFCENNAEAMVNFMTGKFFECVMPRQLEIRGCLRTLFATMKIVPDNVPLTTNAYCKSIDAFFGCTTTILQQCELSSTPAKLMESLRSFMQKDGVCSTAGMMNLRLSLL